MHRGTRPISSTMVPALLLGGLLALTAAIGSTLPDAWLTQGMYRLAALRALPLFNLAALVLAALALAARFLRISAPTAALFTALLLGGGFFNLATLPQLIPFQRTAGTLVIAALSLLVWIMLRRLPGPHRQPLTGILPARSLALLLLSGFALLHLYARGLPPFSPPPGPNLVLAGVDTLRADHLGCYGYHRDTSPVIDRWAAGAVLFEQCSTVTPRTTQSMAALLTGRHPKDIGVRFLSDRLPREQLSLAEILKNQGYTTIAVIATGIPQGKLEDGFDVVIDTDGEWKADETLRRTLEQLALVKGKYFLFVFFRDPHMPYEPSAVLFDQDYQGRFRHKADFLPDKKTSVFRNDYTAEERQHITALYDAEIRDVDQAFGGLLEAIEQQGQETVVVFWSDHGESLGEHDYYYDHGDLLYQPGLRVPLIISGIPFPGPRVDHQVSIIDLAPTLLGHLGIQLRHNPFQGVDLRRDTDPHPAFSESGQAMIRTAYTTGRRHLHGLRGRLRSLTLHPRKLICIPQKGGRAFEYYDLAGDRQELVPLAQEGPQFLQMKEQLLNWVEEDRPNWTGGAKIYDEATKERLRSLGYLD